MSLFRSSIRAPAPLSDEAVERHVAAIRAGLDPDPLFRRRLRGHVLNRYVATREGIAPRRGAREMSRIGRAVLYASFALSLSVTGVMAASQQSIPGDPFYPLKRQIEDVRMHVLPPHLHDELAASELRARIVELDRLADAGHWDAVARHAGAVEDAYAVLLSLDGSAGELGERLEVAIALLDQLPVQAREVVDDVIAGLHGVAPARGRPHGGVPPAASGSGGPSERPAATRPSERGTVPTSEPTATPARVKPSRTREQSTPPAPTLAPAQPTTTAQPSPSDAGSRGSQGGQGERVPQSTASPLATP